MDDRMQDLGIHIRLPVDFATAEARTVEALKAEGFGVLTEIDVRDTMKKKLNADFRPYKILGACNPSLAFRALNAVPEVGLLLPCNVTLDYIGDQETRVSILNPMVMAEFFDQEEMKSVAEEARARLERVAKALAPSGK